MYNFIFEFKIFYIVLISFFSFSLLRINICPKIVSSVSGEHHLPRAPLVCRRHSSNGSNGPVNVAAVLQSSHWSLNGSLQPPRRMAYAYSHRSASQEAINDVGLTPPAIST